MLGITEVDINVHFYFCTKGGVISGIENPSLQVCIKSVFIATIITSNLTRFTQLYILLISTNPENFCSREKEWTEDMHLDGLVPLFCELLLEVCDSFLQHSHFLFVRFFFLFSETQNNRETYYTWFPLISESKIPCILPCFLCVISVFPVHFCNKMTTFVPLNFKPWTSERHFFCFCFL